jgi:transcriptional regulator with XRE-family HTH domain
MKERLIQLLDLEQLTPSKFADIIGVQRSSISHVISGRNKPSFDFLQKTLKAFPGLNASWLILGEGTMYEQMGRSLSDNLFDSATVTATASEADISGQEEQVAEIRASEETVSADSMPESDTESPDPAGELEGRTQEEELKVPAAAGKKRIVQVMLIYDDDTFKTFIPTQ